MPTADLPRKEPASSGSDLPRIRYFGGTFGALLPFLIFVGGVVAVALSGAPDERGFWPVLILALMAGLALAREKRAFCEAVVAGMARPIVMIMILAWILASSLGILMRDTGLVEGLTWLAGRLGLEGAGFAVVAFLVCALVSVATGSSFGTILICGPILFPAGGLAGAPTAVLAGAIIGGATFGDSIAPISDTTIAGALSQKADIGGTVRSRLPLVLPAAAVALVLTVPLALIEGTGQTSAPVAAGGDPRGLPMLLVPAVVIALLLAGRHLLEGLFAGLASGVALGLSLGLMEPARLLSLDLENMTARSFLIEGIDRAAGISFFTILLMGLVAAMEAAGLLERLVAFAGRHSRTPRAAESWIVGAVSGAVLVTCHSIVAILTVGEFARLTGERLGIGAYRRAHLLSLSVSTVPFILPYFIPVILTANTTLSGGEYGIPPVSPLQAGLHNLYSWMLMIVVVLMVAFGWGRRSRRPFAGGSSPVGNAAAPRVEDSGESNPR